MKKLSTLALAIAIFATTAAQQNQLWVTTSMGGINGVGEIYTANANGSNFHSVYSCDSRGSRIIGTMIMAPNGLLYGVTETGGYGDSCVVCSFNPTTGEFTNIHDFAYDMDSGYSATSGMILASNGLLYGVTGGGGVNGAGVVYTVDPSNNSYNPIYSFDNTGGPAAPYGGLLQLSDGKIYGITSGGGTYSNGTIFRFDPLTNQVTTLHSFNGNDGATPYYVTLIKAANGKLYGMTTYGGANSQGVIFSYDVAISEYLDLFDFNDPTGGTPYGSLMQATNGNLYGMTYTGGTNSMGVLFSFTLTNSNYSVLLNFDSTTGYHAERGLTQANSGLLYGTATEGGQNGTGVVFSYNLASNTYNKVYEFSAYGGYPQSDVYESGPRTTAVNPVADDATPQLSPNPATGSVTIKTDASLTGGTATVTDVTGRTVTGAALTAQNTTLNTQNIPDGIYFVTVGKDNTTGTQKLIIAH